MIGVGHRSNGELSRHTHNRSFAVRKACNVDGSDGEDKSTAMRLVLDTKMSGSKLSPIKMKAPVLMASLELKRIVLSQMSVGAYD